MLASLTTSPPFCLHPPPPHHHPLPPPTRLVRTTCYKRSSQQLTDLVIFSLSLSLSLALPTLSLPLHPYPSLPYTPLPSPHTPPTPPPPPPHPVKPLCSCYSPNVAVQPKCPLSLSTAHHHSCFFISPEQRGVNPLLACTQKEMAVLTRLCK